jgi:hypothetical protein
MIARNFFAFPSRMSSPNWFWPAPAALPASSKRRFAERSAARDQEEANSGDPVSILLREKKFLSFREKREKLSR